MTADTLQRFMFEGAHVRGELVDISAAWRQVQSRRDYPESVQAMLGELLSAAALLSANLKFDGSVVMQIHGDGPVRLVVAECDAELRLRATAKLDPDAEVDPDATLQQLVNANGSGRFAITLDPKDKLPGQQAYQGIVPLEGDSVASIIENYMLRSEQLDTKLWLAADGKISRGLLLQKLPEDGGVQKKSAEADTDTWNRTVMLASTLRDEELLQTEIAVLLHRLFSQETIRLFDPQHPVFHCGCSREKVGNMLKLLGQDEVYSALEELGELSIDCDFCGQHYSFDRVDCAQLFAVEVGVDAVLPPGDLKH